MSDRINGSASLRLFAQGPNYWDYQWSITSLAGDNLLVPTLILSWSCPASVRRPFVNHMVYDGESGLDDNSVSRWHPEKRWGAFFLNNNRLEPWTVDSCTKRSKVPWRRNSVFDLTSTSKCSAAMHSTPVSVESVLLAMSNSWLRQPSTIQMVLVMIVAGLAFITTGSAKEASTLWLIALSWNACVKNLRSEYRVQLPRIHCFGFLCPVSDFLNVGQSVYGIQNVVNKEDENSSRRQEYRIQGLALPIAFSWTKES